MTTSTRFSLRYETVRNRVIRDAVRVQNLRVLAALLRPGGLLRPGSDRWPAGTDRPVGRLGGRPDAAVPGTSVPPIVFQTWKTHEGLPENYAYWRRSFARCNPGYELFLWDDADNRDFVRDEFPWLLETYDSLPSEIFRVDLVRPLFLFAYGGFYADLDCECLEPLDRLRPAGAVLLGRLGPEPEFRHSVPNAIMAARPLQLFWLRYVAEVLDAVRDRSVDEVRALGPEDVTGPVALKRALDSHLVDPEASTARCESLLAQLPADVRALVRDGPIVVLPEHEWYPFDWNHKLHARLRWRLHERRAVLTPRAARRLAPRASIVTYWTASWKEV